MKETTKLTPYRRPILTAERMQTQADTHQVVPLCLYDLLDDFAPHVAAPARLLVLRAVLRLSLAALRLQLLLPRFIRCLARWRHRVQRLWKGIWSFVVKTLRFHTISICSQANF